MYVIASLCSYSDNSSLLNMSDVTLKARILSPLVLVVLSRHGFSVQHALIVYQYQYLSQGCVVVILMDPKSGRISK